MSKLSSLERSWKSLEVALRITVLAALIESKMAMFLKQAVVVKMGIWCTTVSWT